MKTKIKKCCKVFDIIVNERIRDPEGLMLRLENGFHSILYSVEHWSFKKFDDIKVEMKWMDSNQTQEGMAAIKRAVEDYLEAE
jgi:hypothetical protein